MDSEKLRIAREKLTRVFRYLAAVNEHRNPAKRKIREQLWSAWLHDLPEHSSIRKGGAKPKPSRTTGKEAPSGGIEEHSYVLRVQRPPLTQAPSPPSEIAEWLEGGWEEPSNEVALREPGTETAESGGGSARFSDSPARMESFRGWKTLRDEWAKTEKPARASMKLFEALYALHGRIEREAERVELVLGDGVLSWPRPEGDIYHPILLQRLQLQFDASVPEFTVSEADHPVELYSALFQSLPDVDGRAIGRCREELEQEGFHPLLNGKTSEFLKRFVVQLSPRGEFIENGPPAKELNHPRIGRAPVIFLRARTLGYAAAIEGILADLRTREDVPWSLLNIVGEEPAIPENEEATERSNDNGRTETDVLLSKPANPEQIRIARQLEEHGGVLVQGPPGTGKTHTIANLIGHLLAQGKSVLVTSHTTKALRMVRHHIVPELRPLCVSVLENDLDSRKQLESAVGSIAERLSRADAASLEMYPWTLERQRQELLHKLEEVRNELAEARADEYRDIVIGGKPWPPAEAARKVTQEKETYGWIPGPVAAVAPLPLTSGEIAGLYRTNTSLSREDESELSNQLPDLQDLPTPEEFDARINEENRLSMEDLEFRSDLWQPAGAQASAGEIAALASSMAQAVEPLSGNEEWKLASIYAGRYGQAHRQPWNDLIHGIRHLHHEAALAEEPLLKYGPKLSNNVPLEDQESIASEILVHLKQGGKLGTFVLLMHKSWDKFIESTTVNEEPPRRPEHFHALRQQLRISILRRDLATRWDRQMAPLGAPPSSEMGENVEKTLMQFADSVRDCLDWHDRAWLPLQNQLERLGFRWEKFLAEQPAVVGEDGELLRLGRAVTGPLQSILDARYKRLRCLQIAEENQELGTSLKLSARGCRSSKVVPRLLAAVKGEDAISYREAYARLLELKSKKADLDLRNALLTKLETAAPAWATAIRNRGGIHARGESPRDPAAAWTWRQLNDELDRRASVSLEALQARSEKLGEQLRRTTIGLIDKRAWSAQARRTSPRQRQALVGWLDTIRRIGKGHGVRVALLRGEAARKMSECRGAVPVWVMPLSRVVENFDPRTTRFDVVIIDEASQSDVMALVALYLGKTVLVVGDHEQVSPSAVGQDLGIIQNLIFQYLRDIPNSDLYDGQISIYDLARQSFGGTTCLVEHFRSVPEIIQFSNSISYDQRIKPLRDASRISLRPHTVAHCVSGSIRDGKVNRQEALAVASLLAAAAEQPEYLKNEGGKPVGFGVVSLVGDEQAIEIDNLLRKHISPHCYERHRILCGNAAQFQGDERDVVFISLVDTAEHGPLSLRDQELFKQRFNVAASRARDQMWIVHSLKPDNQLKPDDLRRQLIEHAQDPSRLMRALEEREKRPQSVFEREVMKRLLAAGYCVSPQWRVGSLRIDLVVEGESKRLAIACDGDRYHPLERLAEDTERQSVLERMGWIFSRIRSTEFFRNPERALKPVLERLQDLEIAPNRTNSAAMDVRKGSNDLVDRVVRRAEKLRSAWTGHELGDTRPHRASSTANQASGS